MTRRSIASMVLALIASACGSAATPSPKTADTTPAAAKPKAEPAPEAQPAAAIEMPNRRRPGDFFVHRFSGSFRKTPLTLTEEVVGYDDDLNLIVDYTLEEGNHTTALRVRLDPISEEVVKVAKLEGEKEIDMSIAAYEALLAETLFSPDMNEGEIAKDVATCVVGTQEHSCETQQFKVTVGDKPATLIVSRTDALPGRDVSGEIRDAAGKVIYRAELVDMGRTEPASGVAKR